MLPRALQEQLAQQLLDDIEAELKWDRTLEASQEALSKLANKTAADRKAGRIKKWGLISYEIDPDLRFHEKYNHMVLERFARGL